jgi:hypothetical protein
MHCRFDDRNLARELRKKGYSFSEIRERISNLPKGTLNYWLKDIVLTNDQKLRLFEKAKDAGEVGRLKGAIKNRENKLKLVGQIFINARKEGKIRSVDSFFVVGLMLYWAEGAKSTSLEQVDFTNSDPIMIEIMMRWFREIGKVSEEKFKVSLQIIENIHKIIETEMFWSKITKVPIKRFNKSKIKPTPLKGKRSPSYYGTCTIRISDKNLFRKMSGWKAGYLDNFILSAHSSVDRAERF